MRNIVTDRSHVSASDTIHHDHPARCDGGDVKGFSSSLDRLKNKVWYHLAEIYPYADLNRWTDRVIDVFCLSSAGGTGQFSEGTEEISKDTDERVECTGGGISAIKDEGGKPKAKCSQEDILLITYGNSITKDDEVPLRTLKRFLRTYLKDEISIVHILPFFPYSSDDGFAVMDYFNVNPALGEWEDISAIAEEFKLMTDLVVNHTSSRCGWFENFKNGIDPGQDYYVSVTPDSDISKVIRPRTSPLLREVETPEGIRHVWCTFSHDQVDLDFKNPKVLLEFLRIIDLYMEKGATIFRLDAVAFLWKELCTTCLHLHQTHEIIKLFRTLVEFRDPDALLITETNVPIHENLSYLGNGDEAHVIYNFPLPPLLLYTLVTGDTTHFNDWLRTSPDPISGTTFLNFIASHDGIGLRPVEGVLSDDELSALIQCMEAFGGKISTRALNDHRQNPYEINISLWDAFKGTVQTVRESQKGLKSQSEILKNCRKTSSSKRLESDEIKMGQGPSGETQEGTVKPDAWQFERFICAHAVMLALRGIPAFYIHSLLGTENDYVRMENTASNRAINRHIWDADLLYRVLNGEGEPSHHKRVFKRLKALIDIRKKEPAFHPDANQIFIDSIPGTVTFLRKYEVSADENSKIIHANESIYCLYNITDRPLSVPAKSLLLVEAAQYVDLISEKCFYFSSKQEIGAVALHPYQFMWLTHPR